MNRTLRQIVDSRFFHRFIIGVIVGAAILVGLETSPELRARYGPIMHALDGIILAIFVVEIAMKMAAHGRNPWRYFRDPWNVFDFTIVVICFLPMQGQFAAVLRLVRILRVLRLVSNVPRLQLLVGALLKSMPSMGYVGFLLFLLFYIYGVMGTFLFGAHDPIHFGSLVASMLALFRTVTMEDWTDLMYTQMYGAGYVEGQTLEVTYTSHAPVAVLYFVSFILFGTMIMLNLFIGVIMKSMNEMQLEAEYEDRARHQIQFGSVTVADDIKHLEHQLDRAKEALQSILLRVNHELQHKPLPGRTEAARLTNNEDAPK
jgi:voltage-gated sodium channel